MGMAVATKLNALVTGELAGHRCVLINTTQSAEYLSERGMLPFGYRPRITLSDGSIMDGVLKPVHIWYIETPDARIVVDTSFESAAAVHKTQTGRGQPMFLHRKEEWEIPAALASVGVQPEDIDIVILSHCHYDHCGSNSLFKRARFYAHRRELELVREQPPFAAHYHPGDREHIAAIEDRLLVVDDELEIVPGVRVWRAGGHSPGCMVVVVESERGPVAIMGDVMHDYLNLDRWWPGTSNNYWDIQEIVDAYARTRKEARIVLPGHDWKLWEVHPGGRVLG